MKLLFKKLTIVSLLGISSFSIVAQQRLSDADLSKAKLSIIAQKQQLSGADLSKAKLCEMKLELDPDTKREEWVMIPETCR